MKPAGRHTILFYNYSTCSTSSKCTVTLIIVSRQTAKKCHSYTDTGLTNSRYSYCKVVNPLVFYREAKRMDFIGIPHETRTRKNAEQDEEDQARFHHSLLY